MTMQDPIADLLTRIRNALSVKKKSVTIPYSKVKSAICGVLLDEGFISSHSKVEGPDGHPVVEVELKYYEGKPVIDEISRVSSPGLRCYKAAEDLPKVKGGLGVAVISTSKGLMTDKSARKHGLGGEVLCTVS